MDEQFVQGVIGGVLNRHKNRTLDKNRIQTLMVEIAAKIAAVLERATQYTNVKEVQKAVDNPLNIEMWKGYKKTIKEEELSKEYLDYWTCDICNDNTHDVDYDYLGNGTNHLGCELKEEELQKPSRSEEQILRGAIGGATGGPRVHQNFSKQYRRRVCP